MAVGWKATSSRKSIVLFELEHESGDRIPEIAVGLDGQIVGWNEAAEALYGYRAEEIVGLPLSVLYPLEEDSPHADLIDRVLTGADIEELSATHRTKEGREFQVYYTLRPERNAAGTLQRLSKVIQRVTERAEDKVAFWESTTWIRAVIDSAVDAIVVINERGIVSYINPACEKAFAYESGEVLGQNVSMLMPMPHRQDHDMYIQRYVETGKRHIIGIGREVEGRRKDGTLFPLHLSVSEARIRGRRIFTAILRDISETHRALEEQQRLLLELQERNKKISCLYGVYEIIRGTKNEDSYFERVAARIPESCQSPEHTAARIVFDSKSFVSSSFRSTEATNVEPIVVGGRKRGAIEIFVDQEEGAGRALLSEADRDMVQSIARTLGESEERREAVSQLIQASKLASIGELAAGVSHEINNPINGIINCADILMERLAPGSDDHQFATLVRSEADRIALIVRNLLAFSRHEPHTPSLAPPRDIVDVVLSLVKKTLEKSLIHLIVEVPEDLPRIRCRSEQLHQVLMNIIINAIHALDERFPFGDPDKRLIIRGHVHKERRKEWVRISIEDHGTGVAPENMDRLFDPFFTTKGRDKGTGLGLSVSAGIIRAHGGNIHVMSEPEKYTRFCIDLPLDGPKTAVNAERLSSDG